MEPQQDGRLLWHIMLYSSVLSPELLEKAAAASSMALQSQIGKMLDSMTCTTVPCDIHQWYNDILSSVKNGVCVSDLWLRLGYCKCMRYQSLVPSH